MNAKRLSVAAAAALLCFALAPAGAQGPAGVQLALDRPVELEVADAPIGEVFRKLTAATGVRFVIAPSVYECLPYGDQTRLAVKLKNVTLRKALSPMLSQQAMEWSVEDDAVRIVPAPALLRMNRRATYDELRTLGKIYSVPLEPADKASVIDQLRKVTATSGLKLAFHVKGDQDVAVERANRILPATGAAWLDMLCHGRGWTWYLWNEGIVVMDKADQVARQLQRHVSLRYENAALADVLLDLARRAHVALTLEPGVLNLLPPQVQQNFNLMMTDATIAQALEVISGATGLKFTPTAEGIHVAPSERLKEQVAGIAPVAARPRTPFFLKRTITLADGSTMELLIRPDDLPPELQRAIEADRAKLIGMLMEKYHVTTRPAATQPAN